jgi:gamma-glutamylcyclotransferase (GGCT)/AIG2-like uncharacterized protein YtfP
MKEYLFAYGTLIPEAAPEEVRAPLQRLRLLGSGSVPGRLYNLGDYPGAIVDTRSKDRICGDVYELPDDPAVLEALDAYEEFDPEKPEASLFRREQHLVTFSPEAKPGHSGSQYPRQLSCWMYVYNRNPDQASLVPSGTFAARCGTGIRDEGAR